MSLNPNFYTQTIGGQKADFYRICIAYGITDPCIAHALKKLLRAGRSHKTLVQDIQDAIDTLKRWQEIQEEDMPLKGICIAHCDETQATKEMVDEALRKEDYDYFTEYFPVRPDWHIESGALDCVFHWDKPGWYIIESDPFSNWLHTNPEPSRELALKRIEEMKEK